MRVLNFSLLLFLLSLPAFAVCGPDGPNKWACPSTGNALNDGANLWAFIYNQNFACGDTITLDAGADYTAADGTGPDYMAFRFRYQPTCAPGQMTQIVSSRLAELPVGIRVWSDPMPMASVTAQLAKMPHLVSESSAVIGWYNDSPTLSGANGYAFRGVAFTTGPILKARNGFVPSMFSASFDDTYSRLFGLHDVEFDRCVMIPYEEGQYGSLNLWYTDNQQRDINTWETHFRSIAIEMGLGGKDESLHESFIGGNTGFDPTPSIAIVASYSGGTNSNPAILYSPGIATALNITSYPAECASGCTSLCYFASAKAGKQGCVLQVFKGATGGWGGTTGDQTGKLNGAKLVTYVDEDHVSVWEANMSFAMTDTRSIDSRTWGPFSGTVQGKGKGRVVNDVQYQLAVTNAENIRIENNLFSGWGMNIMFGSPVTTTPNSCNLLPGSTWNTLICDRTVTNLAVGDWIEYPTDGSPIPPNCSDQAPNTGCHSGDFRVGIVTGIAGDTITITGDNAGLSASDPTGIPAITHSTSATSFTPAVGSQTLTTEAGRAWTSVPPGAMMRVTSRSDIYSWILGSTTSYVGTTLVLNVIQSAGTAHSDWDVDVTHGQNVDNVSPLNVRWNGFQTSKVLISGNTIVRDTFNWQGKGYIEVKNAKDTLLSGNQLVYTPDGGTGAMTHNQGWNPWAGISNLQLSDNLFGGPLGNSFYYIFNGQDSEGSLQPSKNPRFINNLEPGMRVPQFASGGPRPTFAASGSPGALFAHNLILPTQATETYNYNLIQAGDALPRYGTYGHLDMYFKDNITGFGGGPVSLAAWDNYATGVGQTAILGNVFLSGPVVTPSYINTNYPGNHPVVTRAEIGTVGPCVWATWEQCALDPASPFKGTATDGLDPGPDVPLIKDRANRWGQRAGLVAWNHAGAWQNEPTAWSPSTRTVTATATIYDNIANCSFHLYTNAIRTIEAADTSGAGNSACNRVGNTVIGSSPPYTVSLVFGNHSALTPTTKYYWSITDGTDTSGSSGVPGGCVSDSTGNCSRVMVGSVATVGIDPCAGGVSYSSSTHSSPAAGDSGTISVTAPVTCSWITNVTGAVTISSGGSGTGSGTISWTMPVNAGAQRMATISSPQGPAPSWVDTQAAQACYDLSYSPTTHSSLAAGDTGSFSVAVTDQTCPWTASSSAGWLTITAGSSGAGNGTISWAAATNSGALRSATISSPQGPAPTRTDTQAAFGPDCSTLAFSPTTHNSPFGGDSGTISVTVADQICAWTTSITGAVTISSGGSGTGNGTIYWTMPANSGAQRMATISSPQGPAPTWTDTGAAPRSTLTGRISGSGLR